MGTYRVVLGPFVGVYKVKRFKKIAEIESLFVKEHFRAYGIHSHLGDIKVSTEWMASFRFWLCVVCRLYGASVVFALFCLIMPTHWELSGHFVSLRLVFDKKIRYEFDLCKSFLPPQLLVFSPLLISFLQKQEMITI